MARQDRERDAAAIRVFPPAIPLGTVLAGLALDRLWPLASAPAGRAWHYWGGGLIVAGAVLGLGLWSVIALRRRGQSENPWTPTTRIVEAGPFRVSRNPMYLQMVLVCVGLAVMLWNLWILLLVPVCVWAFRRFVIAPEEAYLARRFGEPYIAYTRRVRRWI